MTAVISDFATEVARLKRRSQDHVIANGGGPPHDSDMDQRVTRLEVSLDHQQKTLDEIRGDLKAINARLGQMPTVAGLWGMVATVIGVALAIAGLTFVIADYASRF